MTTTTEPLKPFTVSLFGSHPDEDNDDCWTGNDYATLTEAEKVFVAPWETFLRDSSVAYFVLEGPGIDRQVRANPAFKPSKDYDSAERSERAMQAGMAFGCDGYNDEMGW